MSEQINEFRLKDLVNYIGEVKTHILGKWYWILISGLVFGIIQFFITANKKPMYVEKLTFMMDEKTGPDIPGLEILGDLFGKGGGGGGDNSFGKILELFESKRIIHNTLFKKVQMNGKEDFLANHLIDYYTLDKLIDDHKKFGIMPGWPEVLRGKNLKFTHAEIDSFDNDEGLLLNLLYEKISGNPVNGVPSQLTSDFNAESGIMTISMKSEFEDVTLAVLNITYEQLSEFFIERTIEKQEKTFKIVKAKKDSIEYALKRKEYALADFKDKNRNLVTVKGYLDQVRLEREAQLLYLMNAEVIKQYETTDFALKNKTPVVQIIDKPRSPILPTVPSAPKAGILWFLIGSLLATALIYLRFQYNKAMSDD